MSTKHVGMRRMWMLLGRYFRSKRASEDLDEELRTHVEIDARQRMEAGDDYASARLLAAKDLGNAMTIKEVTKEIWGGNLLEGLKQDVRYGLRLMGRGPLFAAAAIFSLSLGIGATAAVFSVFDAVLLRPLPFPEPDSLVTIWEQNREQGVEERRVAPANFTDWRAESKSFRAMGLWPAWTGSDEFNLVLSDGTRRVNGMYVSSGVFETLQIAPLLGKPFSARDDTADRSAILSYDLWTAEFGGDPKIIGRSLVVDSFQRRAFSIIGVMPRGFSFPGREEVWLSASTMGVNPQARVPPWFSVLGRLRDGVSPEQASTELSLIQRRIAQSQSNPQVSTGVRIVRLADQVTGRARTSLVLLMATAGIVLLIACVNMANLLLARGMSRAREFALRSALGAARLRLIRQLLAESVTYSLFAAVMGIAIAYWAVYLIRVLGPQDIPRLATATVDIRVIGFSFLLSLASASFFGIAPALSLSEAAQADSLKDGRSVSAARGNAAIRNGLVVSEVALSLMLLIACGLLVKSLLKLQRLDLGYEPSGVVTARVDMSGSAFSNSRRAGPNRPQVFTRALLERLQASPGVLSVAAVNHLPPFSGSLPERVTIDGDTAADTTADPKAAAVVRAITPGYFRAMNVQFRKGRDFTDFDNDQTPDVVILNDTAARRFFGAGDPVGRQVDIGLASRRERESTARPTWHKIVGVVADAKNSGLAKDIQAELYKPDLQWSWHGAYIVVRTQGDPAALASTLRANIRNFNASVPVTEVRTMPQVMDTELAQPRFRTALTGLFGIVASVLAMAGVFSLQVYWVALRMREFGIRIALGATAAQIQRLAVLNGMKLVSAGVALGLVGALVLSNLLASVLYGVDAVDASIFAISAALLLVLGLVSCWLPARSTAGADPMIALRSD